MKARLAKKGAPSKEIRRLISDFNDWIDTASAEDKIRYARDYHSVEELRNAYANATGNVIDVNSADNIEKGQYFDDAKIEGLNVSNEIPDGFDIDLDPNAGQIADKPYSKDVTDPTMQQTVPEPIFTLDPTTGNPSQGQEQPQSGGQQNTDSGQHYSDPTQPQAEAVNPLHNPEMTELGEKEKKIAATQMVDMILGLYESAHHWVKPAVKIKDKKLIELEAKGIIDPTDTLPIDEAGTQVTARQLVAQTNQSIEIALTPDPTFNGKVREPMIREFTKRGLGVTDLQYILIMFGQDIAMKGSMVYGLKKGMNQILDIYKDKQKERKESINAMNVKTVEPDSISMGAKQPEEEILETEPAY